MHDRGRRGAVVVDAGRHHVADEERGVVLRRRRETVERGCHVRSRAIRPHDPLRDLPGQLDHAAAERREHDRRKLAHLGRVRAQVGDELPDVLEGLARADSQAGVDRPVTHADPKPEPAVRQLMDERRHLRVLEGVARVDVGDAGSERDLAGRERQRLAQGQTVAGARAVEPGESLALEPLGHLEHHASPSGHRDEADRRFGGHSREYTGVLATAPQPHYDRPTSREGDPS